ncbi:Actin-binding protein like [Heracleum sosnowskyi]|uniref:Actin-binding protein like n=1 Tax=Heracleum sosnowskyi TaxID=360622 RepID=A0AAD8JGF1_9APIA|nr:Actin-binding protein like [Heracleum sosnowskyi]
MADFSFLSDSDDDKKVDVLLSQAMDESVLEQISAINCSGFTDPILPTQLETRFSKLKSFPAAKPMSQIPPIKPFDPQFESDLNKKNPTQAEESKTLNVNVEETPVVEKGLGVELSSAVLDSPSNVSGFSMESAGKKGKDGEVRRKAKSRSGSFRSRSDSKASSKDSSPSPTRMIGCFWCSPKRVSSRKSKECKIDDDWGGNEEFLSDTSDFSTKGQEKLLKKMMKEEERINREAAKIVKWAKQASARMELSDDEDEISDNESTK